MTIYAEFYEYQWAGEDCIQITIHDYKANHTDRVFDNMEQVQMAAQKYLDRISDKNIYIISYIDGCKMIPFVQSNSYANKLEPAENLSKRLIARCAK